MKKIKITLLKVWKIDEPTTKKKLILMPIHSGLI